MSDIYMTDNWKNNQSVINCKSKFNTYINNRKLWRIFCYDCNLYKKVLNLLLYVDITLKVLEFLQHVINVKLLKLLV